MIDRESPFDVQPRPTPSRLRWLLGFGRSMGERSFRRGIAALVELSRYSLNAYADSDRWCQGRIGFERQGLLMLALTQRGLASAVADAELLAECGVSGETLDADGVRRLEPAIQGDLEGGVYYPDEAHLRPLAAVEAIAERARRSGVCFERGTEAFDFEVARGRVREVVTTRGRIAAGNVILATGAWSMALARRPNLRVPVRGGKGYSMMVRAPRPAPEIPMMILERNVAVTPYGLPIIGRAPALENVFIATGHQMSGTQTGPATGRLVTDLVLEREPVFDPAPLRRSGSSEPRPQSARLAHRIEGRPSTRIAAPLP